MAGFIIAGHETSANTLTWTMLELGRNPDVVKKLREELDGIDVSGDVNWYEILPKFKYLDQVICESQRFHPVVQSVIRTSLGAENIVGYDFPKDVCTSLTLDHFPCSNLRVAHEFEILGRST